MLDCATKGILIGWRRDIVIGEKKEEM